MVRAEFLNLITCDEVIVLHKQIVNFPLYFINDSGTSVLRLCNKNLYKKIGDSIYRRKHEHANYTIKLDSDKYTELNGIIYRVLKLATNQFGYKFVKLPDTNGKHTLYVHRLVYRTFVGVIPSNMEINHIDHNKSNNDVSNLELISHSENLEKSVIYYGNKLKPRCKCCGKKLDYSSKSVYCSKCSKNLGIKQKRISQRKLNHPTKDELWKLIKSMPMTSIGKLYGVTDNSIRKIAKSYGLPFRKRDIERQKENENILLDSHHIGER